MPVHPFVVCRRALALGLTLAIGAVVPVSSAVQARPLPEPPPSMLRWDPSLAGAFGATLAAATAPAPRGVGTTGRPTPAPAPAVMLAESGLEVLSLAELGAEPVLSTREQIAARCPEITDQKLLRGGSAPDGHGLCVRSVMQARTDTSAEAIVEGFGLLGLPYSRSRRGSDGYDDCSSFVGRAYREAGRPLSDSDWEPSSSVMRNASWARVVDEPLPGDILWRRGHVAMALADGYQMHASQSGDVTHVRTAGRYRTALAVDPR